MPKISQLFCYTRTATWLWLFPIESASRRQKSIEILCTYGSCSVNEWLIPENYTFNPSQLHNVQPL